MKAGWITTPIEEFARTSAGGTPAKSQKHFYDGGAIPWLLSGEVGQRDITVAQNFITEAGLKGSSAKLFPANSVLVAMYGATAGEVGILRIEAATNQAVCAVLPNERYVPEFLYYFLLFAKEQLVAQAVGNAQPNISQAKIRALPVPLPPLDEQKRIVAVLDEAFEGLSRARANAEANLADARELFRAVVNEAFSSIPKTAIYDELQTLCDARGITYGVIKLGDHVELGVPCLRTSNIRPLSFELDGMKKISQVLSAEYRRTILRGGEVLVNVRGTLGGVGVVSEEMAGWNISREVAMVPVETQKALPEFVAYFISTKDAQDWLTGVVKGAAYKGINLADLRLIKVPSLALDDQAKLVAKLDEAKAGIAPLVDSLQDQLAKLTALRQSLLQKAFSGELT